MFNSPSGNEVAVELLIAGMDRKLDIISRALWLLLKEGHIEMATLDDIVADEAALKTGNQQLIQLVGNAIAEIATLKTNTTDPATQAKLDALHQNLTSDLSDVTSALTADASSIDVPPAAPVPGTDGATGTTA